MTLWMECDQREHVRGSRIDVTQKLAFLKWKCSLCAINGNVDGIKLKALGLKLKSLCNPLMMDIYTS